MFHDIINIVKSNALVLHAIHQTAGKFFMDKNFIATAFRQLQVFKNNDEPDSVDSPAMKNLKP
jgi:hypothetical protein